MPTSTPLSSLSHRTAALKEANLELITAKNAWVLIKDVDISLELEGAFEFHVEAFMEVKHIYNHPPPRNFTIHTNATCKHHFLIARFFLVANML